MNAAVVHTFLATLHVLLEFRHRNNGLLLSELGAYLTSPDHAPAGTKRLSNLVRSAKWTPQLIERFLWQQTDQRLLALEQAGEEGLLLWDESVIEKPESIARDRLVRRSIEQGPTLKAHQAWLLQPTRWPPPLLAIVGVQQQGFTLAHISYMFPHAFLLHDVARETLQEALE
jgi:hypothetical protein